MSVGFTVSGLDDVLKTLDRIGDKRATTRIVRAAAKKAMTPVLESAKRKAPRETGALQDSLIISAKRLRNGNESVRVGPNTDSFARIGDDGSVDLNNRRKPANYAHLVEYGHTMANGQRVTGKPFLRPAWDQNSARVEETFSDEMAKGVQRLAKRKGVAI